MNNRHLIHRVGRLFEFGLITIFLLGRLAEKGLTAGIGTQFADVVLEYLKPGETYNLLELKKLPYIVYNPDDKPKEFEVAVESPRDTYEGYEPVPDVSWLKVIPNKFRLDPGENQHCSIIFSIPDDQSLVGRHFQIALISKAAPLQTGGAIAVIASVRNNLRFSVGSAGPESIKALKKQNILQWFDFDIQPNSLHVANIDIGRAVRLKKEKRPTLKLVNRGQQKVKLVLKSIPYDKTYNTLENYLPAPDPSWLKFKKKVTTVKPDRIESVDMTIEFPDKEEYRGKKYVFIVKAEVKDWEVPVDVYSRVYVTIKD